ncbi:RHS Repeat protein [compost metagenome]
MEIRKGKCRHGQSRSIVCSVLACVLSLGALAIQAPAWAGSVSYSYDTLGRVKQVVYNDGSKTTTIVYNYDAAGNRTSVVTTKSP